MCLRTHALVLPNLNCGLHSATSADCSARKSALEKAMQRQLQVARDAGAI